MIWPDLTCLDSLCPFSSLSTWSYLDLIWSAFAPFPLSDQWWRRDLIDLDLDLLSLVLVWSDLCPFSFGGRDPDKDQDVILPDLDLISLDLISVSFPLSTDVIQMKIKTWSCSSWSRPDLTCSDLIRSDLCPFSSFHRRDPDKDQDVILLHLDLIFFPSPLSLDVIRTKIYFILISSLSLLFSP